MRDYTGLSDTELYARLDAVAFEYEALRSEVVRRGRAKNQSRSGGEAGSGGNSETYYGPYGYGTQDR